MCFTLLRFLQFFIARVKNRRFSIFPCENDEWMEHAMSAGCCAKLRGTLLAMCQDVERQHLRAELWRAFGVLDDWEAVVIAHHFTKLDIFRQLCKTLPIGSDIELLSDRFDGWTLETMKSGIWMDYDGLGVRWWTSNRWKNTVSESIERKKPVALWPFHQNWSCKLHINSLKWRVCASNLQDN